MHGSSRQTSRVCQEGGASRAIHSLMQPRRMPRKTLRKMPGKMLDEMVQSASPMRQLMLVAMRA
jgi:hypothetical protein